MIEPRVLIAEDDDELRELVVRGLREEGFDAVEAFNGIWLETPAKIREGAIDLVGLARRGLRVTATGNSDSHRLV